MRKFVARRQYRSRRTSPTQSRRRSPHPVLQTLAGAVALAALTILASIGPPADAQASCENPTECENQLPGTDPDVWDVTGAGDSLIQGFATEFSVDAGQPQQFKISTNASSYTIDIYRMGYYGGLGARLVTSITPSATLPQSQPNCLTQSSTGLFDCGNWAVSATWNVPATAVSGIYFAKITRTAGGGGSHIFFVVRDDDRKADLVFQTSDTTWQAYNSYGGNSLYVGGPGTNPGRAYKVSYNRPFNTRGGSPEDWVFNAEYPMVRWLERNGYDVAYIGGADTDRAPGRLLNAATKPKAFLSVGHDEYWSGPQRANVEALRDAGVHLAFFSGNAIFWKTRWETSIDGSGRPYRTLVSYKETHADGIIDPANPPTATATWRDPRFGAPSDGGRPENALMGTSFRVNAGTTAISVPAAHGKHRFWRHTDIATMAAGQEATLAEGSLGYEWDEAPTNAFTPPGLMRLSATTAAGQILLDHGSQYGNGVATHNLTLYRHPSGALVFGGGTIQWSWGLDNNHDRGNGDIDTRMKQATVNLFADMGVQAANLEPTLTQPTASNDGTAPTSTITSPVNGSSFAAGATVTVSGTATDSGGGIVAGVEITVDNGATWIPATGTTSWTAQWTASGSGTISIQSRAFDDTGNAEIPGPGVLVNVGAPGCPCTLWETTVPPVVDVGDANAVELGTRFYSETNGFITGVRFYKSPLNTGTHTGRLWSNTGSLLGSVTFSGETSSGWQIASFSSPIAITANTVYLVSYHAPNGHYAASSQYFASAPLDNPPLHAPQDGVSGANGVYRYGSGGVFPTDTFQSSAYWVDPVFTTTLSDTTPPTVTATSPLNGATSVATTTAVTATFSEPMQQATISGSTFELRDPLNNVVPSGVTYNSSTNAATLQPSASLAASTTYTASVRGGAVDPRVKDLAGNAMAASVSWSFTTAAAPPPGPGCPCTIWTSDVTPAIVDTNDSAAVELGTRFQSDVAGFVTGARYYKSAANTGTHVARLWSNTGTLLGSVTFAGETSTGWQEAAFTTPIAIAANTPYVISYHAPNGHYSHTGGYFASSGVDRPPLHALQDTLAGGNGVFLYGPGGFPTNTFNSNSYFVDVVFNTTTGPDTTPPVVTAVSPSSGQSGISTTPNITATFNEAIDATTVTTQTVLLRDAASNPVQSSVTYNASTRTATLTPTPVLNNSTTYTVVLKGGTTDPRIKDTSGNALSSDFSWSFTTAAPPPPPPGQGPGGPVLVITAVANPFTTYLAEILRNEGVNAFLTADISTVTASMLSEYDVVVLGHMSLTGAQVTMLSNWTTQGGNLIAMRPDKQLAGFFGLTDATTTLSDAYLLVNTATAPGAGIVGQTIQFHGTADRYTITAGSGATAVATLYSTASTATANPAVTIRNVGISGGQAVAFTYDLARSVVYTRQGNPAWSGQERDGTPPIRPNDLFYGGVAADWVDLTKVAIPQADEQQRLLWNTILHVNADRKPLPRFWYFPRMLKAVVVMTGDDHGIGGTIGRFDQYLAISPAGCSVANWECIRGTSYIYPTTPLSAGQVSNYVSQGFELALHINTGCGDYSPSSLAIVYESQLQEFAASFPGAPAPATNRTHCIAWSDYDTQPQVQFENGIRLDTSYYYWPGSWILDRPGMFTGSGMPMRFATLAGEMVDVFQATTQLTDESNQTYPDHAATLFDRALGPEGYYGAFTANMHTDANPSPGSQGSDAIIGAAQARGVPVITSKQMLDWLDGRNGSSFDSITWGGNILSFDVLAGVGSHGLRALVPATAAGGPLTGITRNGTAVSHTLETIKGVSYAIFEAQAGAYQVAYGTDITPPVITNVTASPGSTSATITWLTNETSDSRVDYGTAPNSLTQNAGSATAVTSHSVTLTGLTQGTTYHYRVSSADGGPNVATFPALTDPPATFTTTSASLPSLSIANASVTEGNAGTANAVFNVTLSAASSSTVTVAFATSGGTATADTDFVTTSGTLTFNPDDTVEQITVPVVGDTTVEPDEQFVVNLSTPTNATLANSQATGTILNDDGGVPSLSITDVTVTEGTGSSVNAVLTVSLSASSSQAVSVNYATADGTAAAGSDYTAASGPLNFAAGETTRTITIQVTGDALDEANETFTVNLSTPVNATIADGQGVVTITDNDATPALAISDRTVTEGNSGSVDGSLTVSLSAASGQIVTVNYATANGTATAADYTGGSGTLTFPIGSTSQVVPIQVLGDTLDETDETVLVNLSGATNATLPDPQGQLTITDDDPLPSITVADSSVVEGNSGTRLLTFTVTLSPASGRAVSVNYATANSSAVSTSDYLATSGTANFAAGATTATVNVTVNGDTVAESDEVFFLNLSGATNATIGDTQAVGTITNDDALPSITIANRTVTEGNTGNVNANFTITLSPSSGSTVTVQWATADGTATAGQDYVAASGTVSFSPGATSRTITVVTSPDTIDEDNETFFVNLSNAVNANITDNQGLGTINDNDALPALSIADTSVTEGNSGTATAVFTVTLSPASGRQVTVNFATANGTASAGSDYVSATGTVTFAAGVTSLPVSITINGDTSAETNENFVVNLSSAVNATIADTQALGVILNDDGGTPPPAGLVAAYGFEEGGGPTTADGSGNGHVATISGATWTAGRNGGGLSFDGVNDIATIADSAALDVTRITMMAWVRPSTLLGWRTALMKARPGGLAYALYANDNLLRPIGYVNINGTDRSSEGNITLAANAWTHLAVTFDGSRVRIYVNGALIRTRNASGNITTSTGILSLGGNQVWGEFFGGVLDDVRIYNRALSQTEIQTDMSVPVP